MVARRNRQTIRFFVTSESCTWRIHKLYKAKSPVAMTGLFA